MVVYNFINGLLSHKPPASLLIRYAQPAATLTEKTCYQAGR